MNHGYSSLWREIMSNGLK